MEQIQPLKGEFYTAAEIAHKISLDNTLNHIVKAEVNDEKKGVTEEGEEVLLEPDE